MRPDILPVAVSRAAKGSPANENVLKIKYIAGGGEPMFKFTTAEFLSHPVHASAFIADFALLMFLPLIRPPVILSILLVGGLVYLSMYFGAVFSTGRHE
jgi:hypothetical protein